MGVVIDSGRLAIASGGAIAAASHASNLECSMLSAQSPRTMELLDSAWRSPRLGLLVSLVATLVLLFGCAQPRDPIDRVQPNVVRKSTFAGQWYYQRTVVDVSAANGFTFVGNTDHGGLQPFSPRVWLR